MQNANYHNIASVDIHFHVHNSLKPESLTYPLSHRSELSFWTVSTTTLCFLLLQATKLPNTKVQYPESDLLSEMEPAKSAYVYTSISLFSFFSKSKPLHGVPFKYLRIRYTASKCFSHGECIN